MNAHASLTPQRAFDSGMAGGPAWERAPRYSDQPLSLRMRIFGMGSTALTGFLIAAGLLLSWGAYQAVQAPVNMAVFDVAPPAAPPEPPSEVPPGPEQAEKEEVVPDPDQPTVDPSEIQLLSANVVPAPKPVSDPGPPVQETTAPETKPVPPAPQVSTGKPTWEGLVLGALNKVKRYPRDASFRRQQGVPYIRFTMDREGRVLSVKLEKSSGIRSLDDEATALPRRAQPLPKPPEEVKGATIELVVPVEFFMR